MRMRIALLVAALGLAAGVRAQEVFSPYVASQDDSVARAIQRQAQLFLMLLGGTMEQFGVAVQSIPARLAPVAVKRILDHYKQNRVEGETFRAYVLRHKVETFKQLTADLTKPPMDNPEMFRDWGDDVSYSLQLGRGECRSTNCSGVAWWPGTSSVMSVPTPGSSPNTGGPMPSCAARIAGRCSVFAKSDMIHLQQKGTPPEEIAAYAGRLKHIINQGGRIKLIQLYTVARHTTETYATPLSAEEIVQGKCLSNVTLAAVFFSAGAPFLAITPLLRGVDVPTVILITSLNFLTVVLLCQAGLVVAVADLAVPS